ncbi:MAG: alpha-L-fucosidase, partial [Gammaproteobacteria bacterium]
IDQYQPDIIWFDSWLDQIPEEYRKEFSALYLNEAEKWGKDVVIVRKQDDLPLNYTVDDLEKSRKNSLEPNPWMTDETISKGRWCYTEGIEVKASVDVLHVLIDIVSKNGVLLLNISPKADGSIPNVQQEVLLDMGSWLDQFGEAIYATRPWYTFGEGPTREPEGHFKNREAFLNLKYSWKDARYTTKEQIVYATLLGSPDKGTSIDLLAFAADSLPEPIEIKSVELLGSEAPLEWKLSDEGLNILIPETDTNEMAIVFKIETK